METATPAGLPPKDAPAPDVTGPDMTQAGLSPPKPASHSLPTPALTLTALAGLSLAALIRGRRPA